MSFDERGFLGRTLAAPLARASGDDIAVLSAIVQWPRFDSGHGVPDEQLKRTMCTRASLAAAVPQADLGAVLSRLRRWRLIAFVELCLDAPGPEHVAATGLAGEFLARVERHRRLS